MFKALVYGLRMGLGVLFFHKLSQLEPMLKKYFKSSEKRNAHKLENKNDHKGNESDDQCPTPPGKKLPLAESSSMASMPNRPNDLNVAQSTQGFQGTASVVNHGRPDKLAPDKLAPDKLATVASLRRRSGRNKGQGIPGTFGKDPSAMPSRILSSMMQSCKSVGYLLCGDYNATCWLLDENVIITCKHVFSDIDQIKSGKTGGETYETVYVDFSYEHPRSLKFSHGQRVIDNRRYPICTGKDLDYTIRFLRLAPRQLITIKPSNIEPSEASPKPLLLQTRSRIPPKGHVILVGHPDGLDKRFEVCTIVPKENRNESLCERAREAAKCCQSNPSRCRNKIGPFVSCVHDYGDGILTDNHYRELAYHTSFYDGSSGSPVFNDDGHIIAMHTGGYKYKKGPKRDSLMEFGLPISAIYEDVAKQIGQVKANQLFPKIFDF
ncbi:protein FAM111A-like [Dendronephthya gigantea]|uniref:protein FAM111A-like n=1 Tax=Dendronephthya gigantea TaxID=151771 RepID=UPI001068F2B5|nr:protein FAM111A-like [Dendronephthya gigantea]XP_028405898.1 protein FAM111A-like [Dendronephthya gigantea]XP_028405899.1 protein FAM111A-like [Dendronephthya gigantea]